MRNAEATIQHIVEKASVLFNTKGYAGTSINDIMEETGLKKGGIYRHFESKEMLAAIAFRYSYQKLKAAYLSTFTKGQAADQKLYQFLDTFCLFLAHPPVEGGCPILNTATEVDDTNLPLREEVMKAAKDWEQSVASVYRDGKEKGVFKSTTDPEAEARIMLVSIEGAILLAKLHKDMSYTTPVIESLRQRIQNLRS